MLRLFTNRYDNRKEKKKKRYFQANLFDKLVIRHRSPLRSIFFFDFHLKTTSGVHDSSLSPLLIFSFPSKRERSNYVGSSLAIFLKISGPGSTWSRATRTSSNRARNTKHARFRAFFLSFFFFSPRSCQKTRITWPVPGNLSVLSLSPPLSRWE